MHATDAIMTDDDTVQVRVKRSVWDRIKNRAKERDMSAVQMTNDLLDDRVKVGIGPLFATELQRLQAFCSRHDSELKEFFKYDEEDAYGWLKDFIVSTISEIEHTEDDDQDDDDDD